MRCKDPGKKPISSSAPTTGLVIIIFFTFSDGSLYPLIFITPFIYFCLPSFLLLKSTLGEDYQKLVQRVKKKGDPPKQYSTGKSGKTRVFEVIKHYISTGGKSTITGEYVPFSESQLDHVTSLDNGGVDGAENWEWMESRFNQFKGKRTKPEVMKALEERGLRTDEEWLLEATDDELKNFEEETTTAYWNTIFADTLL